jgi:3-hydroxyacyl-CoA dehydrogenase / enoyl-CoA hydratase / 3-hydroxybutyryl-CoA epimerase
MTAVEKPTAGAKPAAKAKSRGSRAAASAPAAASTPMGAALPASAVAVPRHWHGRRDGDNIHWLTLDKSDSNTNTLSQDVLAAFEAVLNELETHRPAGLVIQSGKANGFIAGADVGEFRGFTDAAEVERLVLHGHAIINRLEALPYPTVALINGFCLGGGLELALACRYRVAGEDARLGLPEVRLGIHPGLGGTARLTRLIPAPAAMGLMLTGRTLNARAAKRMGVVDAVTQPRHFERAARWAVGKGLKTQRRPVVTALYNLMPVRWILAQVMQRQVAAKARRAHYPAPFALIDLWARYGGSKVGMLKQEARSIARLITTDTAQNLVRVFFLNERLKGLGGHAEHDVRHVHVIGAGTMGGDIAAWCAMQGLRVTLQDRAPEFIAPAVGRAAKLYRRRLKESYKVRAALDRLIPDVKGDGIRLADVVIEAVPENLELKHKIYRDAESRMKPGALLATNTSSIPLEELSKGLARPERLIGLHFFNPVAQMPLLEVVEGGSSSADAIDAGLAFARLIDKLPLPTRSAPGFLVNRALTPYLMAAVQLLDEGHDPASIDEAAESFGMPMGPLELADAVGLDICLHVGEILGETMAGGGDWQPPKGLKRLIEQGHLGRKSGQGFYRYDKKGKAIKAKPKATSAAMAELQDRLLLPLLNTCVACWREKLVEDADMVDAGMIFGTGFAPFRGGPIHYLKSTDARALHAKLKAFAERHGAVYQPDPGWESLLHV